MAQLTITTLTWRQTDINIECQHLCGGYFQDNN
jgi:hypothetical protein